MTKDEAIATLRAAVEKLIKAKGRFHTEQNYAALVKAYDETAASVAPSSDPVRYEHRMRAPNGNVGGWHGCDKEFFDKFRAAPDIGDGFAYETRALYAEAPAAPAVAQALPGFVARKVEQAIAEATNPKGMHTNGPAMARIEASQLATLLRYAKMVAAPAAPINTQPDNRQTQAYAAACKMGNVLYNALQQNVLPDDWRDSTRATLAEWDKSRAVFAPLNTAAPTESPK